MRPRVRQQRDERGVAAVLIAALTVVLVGALAFVTDFGMAYANQRQLQNGVDAATLAVGQKIASDMDPEDSCQEAVDALDLAALRASATTFLGRNASGDGVALRDGTAGFSVECKDLAGTGAEQLVVTAEAAQTSPTFFGGVFGADGVNLSEHARAVIGVGIPLGLRPFGVCAQDAEELISKDGALTLTFAKGDEGCGTGSGNWGLLDFDGTGGGRGSGKDCDSEKAMLNCWIREGYAGTVTAPSVIGGQTGSFGGLGDDMSAILGEEVPLPVYSSVSGNGANIEYAVTGYIFVQVCAYDFQGSSDKSSGEADCLDTDWSDREDLVEPEDDPLDYWLDRLVAGTWTDADTAGVLAWAEANTTSEDAWYGWYVKWKSGSWDDKDSKDFLKWLEKFIKDRETAKQEKAGGTVNYLQLKFVRQISAGALDTTCAFGGSCDFGMRVVKLAD